MLNEIVPPLGPPHLEMRIAQAMVRATPDWDHAANASRLATLGDYHGTLSVEPGFTERTHLEQYAAIRARAGLLAELAAGREPSPPSNPAREIAVLMIRRHGNPYIVTTLLARMEQAVAEDSAELERLGAEIEQPDNFSYNLLRPRIERMIVLESRLPWRKWSFDGFKAAFPASVANAIGPEVEALVSGIAESRALDGKLPAEPPEVPAVSAVLAEVDEQLRRVGAVSGVAPGPLALGLRARKEELLDRLDALATLQAQQAEAAIRDEVQRALAGDVAAWSQILQAMYPHPDAFPDGLRDRLATAASEALIASEPLVWSAALEGAVLGKMGREF